MYLLNIKQWGPALWTTMHAVSFTYPDHPTTRDQERYKTFYETIVNIIPCKTCRVHFAELLKRIPIRTESRRSLSEWVVQVHNEVNKSTNKPTLEYLDVVEAYVPPSMRTFIPETQRAAILKSKNNNTSSFIWMLWVVPLFVVLIVLAVMLYKKASGSSS